MSKLQSIEKIIKSRQFTLDKIIRTFGTDKLDSKRVELCATCNWRIDLKSGPPFCKHNLYPLTLAGENCPYCDPQDQEPNPENCEYHKTCSKDPQYLDYCPCPHNCPILHKKKGE